MGMTAQEYWHGDSALLRAYRKADIIKRERMNHEAWLHGAYIYSALCAVSPLFNSMSKKHEAFPYQEKPFKAPEKKKKLTKREEEKQQMLEIRAKFSEWAAQWNAQCEKKSGDG